MERLQKGLSKAHCLAHQHCICVLGILPRHQRSVCRAAVSQEATWLDISVPERARPKSQFPGLLQLCNKCVFQFAVHAQGSIFPGWHCMRTAHC